MGNATGLMINLQLCLAHYCDTHGPTPLMVTEGIPASCMVCYDDAPDKRPRSSAPTQPPSRQGSANIVDSLHHLSLNRSASMPSSHNDTHTQRQNVVKASTNAMSQPTALETPPDSPRPVFQQPRRDSNFRRTYDETVTRKQGPCDNCAMTLPRRQDAADKTEPAFMPGGPTLRTRAPAERVFGITGQASPPASQTSSDTEGERDEPPRQPRHRQPSQSMASSRTTSCSAESTTSERAPFHVHYVNYTSTHEPVVANSFALLRAACLRAMSFETLPRAPATSSPTSPVANTPFVTTQSAGSAATGGPIFFGDNLAGYTTAYIFRIPDVHARGHKRVYAFLALSTHKERLAMKTFAFISNAFRDMALQIQALAEAEAERAATSSPIGAPPSTSSSQGAGYPATHRTAAPGPTATVDRSESSFLTGGSAFTRRMGGPGGSSAPKARGLAELVGQSDFFIDLHKRFVQLLLEVGVTLSS